MSEADIHKNSHDLYLREFVFFFELKDNITIDSEVYCHQIGK